MAWTDEQIATLRALWGEGHSTSAIGARLRKSKNAVVGKANRLGLPPRPSPIQRGQATVVAESTPRTPAPGQHTCVWPVGHPNQAGFHLCGEAALRGKPYCKAHYGVAYVPNKRQRAQAERLAEELLAANAPARAASPQYDSVAV